MNNEIPYVESLPAHWSVIQNRFLFQYDGEKVGEASAQYQLLSLTTAGVKERDINAMGGKVPASYDNYQTVRKGQMVFCLFDLDCSAVFSGISNYDGMITSAYDVFSSTGRMDNAYADYWFKYVFSNRYYKMFSKSIRYTITGDMFRSLKTPVPPVDEQRRIASFLLEQETKVDALIANVQAQIEKLKAYKQSVITEVVTKGLDPSVPMKDSGVEWIEKIADTFRIMRLKNVAHILDQYRKPITADQRNQDSEVLYDYYGASGVIDKIDGYTIDDDVMLIGEDGANLRMRNLPLMYEVHGKAWINNHAHILKPKKTVLFYYLFYALEGLDINPYITGSAQPKLNQENLKVIAIPVPSLEIQAKIVDYIVERHRKIDHLIAIKQTKIDKLNAYKKSLIYEYVTGKKEVP
ncbi:hypothetical protein CXU01_07775 [Akkermansia muciniphila]|uniref:restriction endonuclease subunit S n=1 Tax=Akkermansia muciniphila TaxID=239935 RepID=UPI000C9BA03E|nr:restriction endonuclease subunit S [Akkermansia muciniphila]PNC79781.1 hypothetical protein CXU01_07775 [Akkermansia muciniphila]